MFRELVTVARSAGFFALLSPLLDIDAGESASDIFFYMSVQYVNDMRFAWDWQLVLGVRNPTGAHWLDHVLRRTKTERLMFRLSHTLVLFFNPKITLNQWKLHNLARHNLSSSHPFWAVSRAFVIHLRITLFKNVLQWGLRRVQASRIDGLGCVKPMNILTMAFNTLRGASIKPPVPFLSSSYFLFPLH